MAGRERDYWRRRLPEIGSELQDIADLRVNYAEHPDKVEAELLGELDDIERRFGVGNQGENEGSRP